MDILKLSHGIAVVVNAGLTYEIQAVAAGIVRVRILDDRRSEDSEPALTKYAFIREPEEKIEFSTERKAGSVILKQPDIATVISEDGGLEFLDAAGKSLTKTAGGIPPAYHRNGRCRMVFDKQTDEKFYGFGDQTRERVEHSGHQAIMWIQNVACYIPIPFFMSDRGYALLVNTTWKHYYDMGAENQEHYFWEAFGGTIDFYIFSGDTPKKLLEGYTFLTGRPPLPPLFSFGFWFLCDTHVNAHELVDAGMKFRQLDMPCDILGLEPGWMEKYYDYSVTRNWSPERFPISPGQSQGGHCFISALKNLGFKLELWECNDYDLSFEAERRHVGKRELEDFPESAVRHNGLHFPLMPHDPNVAYKIKMDQLTREEEPWFEHHKKFIDMGVYFFKQDGANQTLEHPDRVWGNGMSDKEMHNLYPLLYSQQMHEGFRDHTGKRPIGFTVNGYAGLQRYTGTWAGDTGGRHDSLVAMLNLAFCAHTYVTCDMEPNTAEGIHFGCLLPWAHHNNFLRWQYPWLLGREMEDVLRYYLKLRYKLIPYLYSHAYEAWCTGTPILRPMKLEFPEDPDTDNLMHQYMLGKDILVGVFTDSVYLPDGEWTDFWTGKVYQGGAARKILFPADRGGQLLIREGAILPMLETMDYIGQKPWNRILLRLFSNHSGSTVIYEDDGLSIAYEKGEGALTQIDTVVDSGSLTLNIGARSGSYINMPERDYEVILPPGMKYERIVCRGKPVTQITEQERELYNKKSLPYIFSESSGDIHLILPDFAAGGSIEFVNL